MAEILNFLQNWNEAKIKISELERKCERYKRLADKVMDHKGVDVIKAGNITVKRKEISRSSVSKADLPTDLWDRYSKKSSYVAYYLTEQL
jgi:hypothetical protein